MRRVARQVWLRGDAIVVGLVELDVEKVGEKGVGSALVLNMM